MKKILLLLALVPAFIHASTNNELAVPREKSTQTDFVLTPIITHSNTNQTVTESSSSSNCCTTFCCLMCCCWPCFMCCPEKTDNCIMAITRPKGFPQNETKQ